MEASASGSAVAVSTLNETERRKRPFIDENVFAVPSDECFIHPIDWHMRMPITLEEHENAQLRRTDGDAESSRLLQRIHAARAKRFRILREQKQISDCALNDDAKDNLIMNSPPIDGSKWIGINSDDKTRRFYIRYIRRQREVQNVTSRLHGIRMEILAQQWKSLKAEIEAVREDMAQMVNVRKLRQNSIICNSDGAANDSNLWVKKYSPRFYTDLLSDDGVNRHLMSWVKLWDECVFKRKTVDVPNIGFVKERGILTLDTGKLRRPNYKLALLSGRAGLGKTTLAKIVAQQAGYATVELNASDSRNVADFEKVLEGAVYTSRTLDRNSRPSCLILDEIDGAPVESIRFLVKAVNSTGKKAIRRPIICICNNMYTSALRELRAIALNIQLNPTSEKRLIQRLIAIAEAENVQIDSFAVRRLAELCQCDVRFAINTMQRLSTLAKGEGRSISVDDIEKIVEREKVGSLSIFEDWSTILDFTHHFDRQGILLPLPERLRLVERVGIERGDDRFVSGLYENCLSANLPLKAVRAGVEAFVFYDHIMYVINNKQNYVFLKYVGIFYMLLHAAMASHTRAKLKYPHLEQTANQRHRESQETLATVHGNLFGRHSPTALVSDVLPLLVQIVQPYIKAMNQQLYSSRDLDSIENAVSIMADYNLTFTPAVVNSVPHYLFQPSIDVLTMFAISDVSSRNFLTNSAREMIAHKILLLHTTGRTVNENAEPKSNTLQIKQIVDNAHALKSHAEGPIRPLFYKFNMGSSTAVKRTIRMHQLLI